MSVLKFNDGMTINVSGPLRVVEMWDGFYVVGEGYCIPVDSRADGEQSIREMNEIKSRKGVPHG
jgi:hypothetical protein